MARHEHLKHKGGIAQQIAQLRHAYSHLKAGRVANQEQFADGLIAPVIQALETLGDDWKRCPRCGKTKPVADFGIRKTRGGQPGSCCGMCRAEKVRHWRRGEPDLGHRRNHLTAAETREDHRLSMVAYISERVEIEDRGHLTPCWTWRLCLSPKGYGVCSSGKRYGTRFVHRISYEAHTGPIPCGLVIDHICRNRACCNPEHLEPVTQAENVQRGARSRASG